MTGDERATGDEDGRVAAETGEERAAGEETVSAITGVAVVEENEEQLTNAEDLGMVDVKPTDTDEEQLGEDFSKIGNPDDAIVVVE